ncbi:MAG TPA: GNAT family N-acetyltransferase [Candidatus Udaeobacter sp.]|jgi:GNAT superfamily N-acetyltransferase
MDLRRGTVADAGPIAGLIASFQPELTVDPSGAGAEQYLASVSEQAEREYLESPRYFFIVAECGGAFAGFIAIRDNTHLFHLFVARVFHRNGLARRLWREAREEAVRRENSGGFTVNSSLNAIPVYEAFGFVPSGPVATVHGISFMPMRLSRLEHEV